MAIDTTAASLFKRMLQQIPANELDKSYNYVLQQEIKRLSQCVEDVALAFAKLVDARNSLAPNQENHPLTDGQATRMMVELYSTLALQHEVQDKLEKVTAAMIGRDTRRENMEADGNLVSTIMSLRGDDKLDNDNEESKMPVMVEVESAALKGKSVHPEEEAISSSDAEDFYSLSEQMENDTTKCKPPEYYEHFVQQVDGLLLHERIRRLPEVLDELTLSMQKRQCTASDVFTSLRFIVWWVRQSAGQGQSLGMYRKLADTADEFVNQLPESVKKTNAQRVLSNLLSTLDSLAVRKTSEDTALEVRSIRAALIPTVDKITFFGNFVEKVSILSFEDRKVRMDDVLFAFKKAIYLAVRTPKLKKVAQAVNTIVVWMMNDPPDACLRGIYDQLCAIILSTTKRMSKSQQKTALQRLGRAISKWLDGKDVMTPLEIEAMQKRVTNMTTRVDKWQSGAVRLDEIDSVMTEVQNIVRCSIVGWSPKNNPTLCDCAVEIERHVKRIRVWKSRQNRVLVIAIWGLNCPSRSVLPSVSSE